MELIFDKDITEVEYIEDMNGNVIWERTVDGGEADNEQCNIKE